MNMGRKRGGVNVRAVRSFYLEGKRCRPRLIGFHNRRVFLEVMMGALLILVMLPGVPVGQKNDDSAADVPVPLQLFHRANSLYRDREYKRAIILYRKAGKRGMDPAVVAFNIGNCYFQAGDLPASAASYRRAVLESNGSLVNAAFNLAGVHYRLGNFGEAVAAYRRALSTDNTNLSAWLYLSEAYEKTGDYIGMQKALETARALNPDDVGIVYRLAQVHVAVKEIDRAVELVREAYELIPEETDFLFYIGDLYLLDKKNEQAIDAYREALTIDPDNYNGHYRLADILAGTGNTFSAMDHLMKALARKPDFTDAAIFLGNIAFDLQWWDRAIGAYAKALSHGDSESVLGLVNCAYELVNRRDTNKAREVAKLLEGVDIRDPVTRREWEALQENL